VHYDPTSVLHRVDQHVALTIVLGGLALACNMVYFYEAARCAARDRCPPFALWATTLFVAHDGNYLLNANKWFNGYGHWFPELFWFALILTLGFEVVFIAQTIRFGRAEIAPRLSERAFVGVVAGALVAAAVIWAVVKQIIADPLFLTSFTVTIAWCLPSATALLLRRGDARGQSTRQYVAFTGMASAWFACNMLVFGPAFRGVALVLLFVVAIVWGAGQAFALHRVSLRSKWRGLEEATEVRPERRRQGATIP
jgi:hypothetical protein